MHVSGQMLEADAEQEARDKAQGVRKYISLAAKKRKANLAAQNRSETQRKLAPKVQ